MSQKPITLRELAKMSGVSISTVSRALAGDSRISVKRRQKIEQLVQRTGYRPQPIRRQRKNAIALLMATADAGRADDDYQTRLAAILGLLSEESGYHFHLRLIPREGITEGLPPIVHEQRVDGVILSGCPQVSLCQALRENKVPAVVMDDDRERTGLCSLRNDYGPVVREVVDRLVSLGHRRLAFCATNRDWTTVNARCEAFLACQDASLSCEIVDHFSPNMQGGREGVRHLLSQPNPPTAILFVNDWMAMGALLEAARMGIDVPGKLSMVGFDNMPMCDDCEPQLCSVDLGLEDLVQQALLRLNEQVTDYHIPDDVILGCNSVWRGSVAPPESV